MDNYYEFKYVDNGKTLNYKFPADIDSNEMYYCLRDFLLGCSWHPETVDKIIGKEE